MDGNGLKDALTMAFAAAGAVLGVINTMHSLNQRRVSLKVIPKTARQSQGGLLSDRDGVLPESVPAIEVVNLSAFPITIAEVGFTLEGMKQRARIIDPTQAWPRRLEPHEAFTTLHLGTVPPNINQAYARTDSGVMRYGTSPALREMKRLFRNGAST